MGEIGQHTRAVAPLYGSKLAFAPLSENSENEIPGQLPLEELSRLIEGTEGPSTSVSLHEGLTNIPPERNTE